MTSHVARQGDNDHTLRAQYTNNILGFTNSILIVYTEYNNQTKTIPNMVTPIATCTCTCVKVINSYSMKW